MRILGRLLILGCLCGVVQAQAVERIAPMAAVDSAGRQVGEVLRVDLSLERMQIVTQVEGKLVFLTLRKDSFTHAARPYVYFEGSDCTGATFMTSKASTDTFGAPSAVAGPNQTIYLGEGDEQTVTIASMLRGTTCEAYQATVPVLAARPVLDLAFEFTAPFEVISLEDAAGRTGGAHAVKPGRRKN